MHCEQFRESYSSFFGEKGQPQFRFGGQFYSRWVEHLNGCQACRDWYLGEQLRSRGVSVAEFPCVHVAYHTSLECEKHKDAWECPDVALVREGRTFGIPVRDGGSSYIEIKYCPWCGQPLEDEKE